ncbi:MAG: hypothetical protein ACK5LJ_09805 [Paracoccus sp. (in: a-proteobacteria)]
MNRRSLLKSAPAVALAACVPLSAAAGETPVEIIFKQWKVQNDRLEAFNPDKIAENKALFDKWEAVWDARWEIEQRLVQTPSQNERDVLLKMSAWTQFGNGDLEGGSDHLAALWAETRALIGSAA